MKFVKLYELKIFTAEDVQCGDEPFFKAVFKEARRLGLGGGTMVRADAGYGGSHFFQRELQSAAYH